VHSPAREHDQWAWVVAWLQVTHGSCSGNWISSCKCGLCSCQHGALVSNAHPPCNAAGASPAQTTTACVESRLQHNPALIMVGRGGQRCDIAAAPRRIVWHMRVCTVCLYVLAACVDPECTQPKPCRKPLPSCPVQSLLANPTHDAPAALPAVLQISRLNFGVKAYRCTWVCLLPSTPETQQFLDKVTHTPTSLRPGRDLLPMSPLSLACRLAKQGPRKPRPCAS
jgi:hypothetical protein